MLIFIWCIIKCQLAERENMNYTLLVGRLVEKPVLKKTENKINVTNMTLAVDRAFKNMDGEYDTDFIKVTCWDQTAANCVEYLEKGSLVGVRGRLEVRKSDVKFENQIKSIDMPTVIAESVHFLYTPKKKEEAESIEKEAVE